MSMTAVAEALRQGDLLPDIRPQSPLRWVLRYSLAVGLIAGVFYGGILLLKMAFLYTFTLLQPSNRMFSPLCK
jgi:hypothetical protein